MRFVVASVAGWSLVLLLAAAAPAAEITVLSTRPELVSGGDALVQVAPAGAKVSVGGRDLTSAFAVRSDGRYTGLLTGLSSGDNVVTADGSRLVLQNHALGGPVLAGPQIQPWTCFPGALDAQCSRPPKVEFFYKPTGGGGLQAYDPANPPSDVATTTTDQGRTVPFIVRQETGAIDRDEYRIAILYDPAKPFTATEPQDGFNHKLVIFHGASCDTAYEQAAAPDVLDETVLGRGFATMSHALDNAGHNCNIATQAESLIMTKEYVIDHFGTVRYTIGSGCSGGSLVQQQVANAYPGLYQGITPACSFTDAWSSAMQYFDYQLLRRYFEDPSRWEPGVAWDPTGIQAVEGHPNPVNAITFTSVIPSSGDPSRSCPGVPPEKVYDAKTNPKGVRCSFQDYMVNVFGRRPGDGFAGRPGDNVGVEYGRRALMAGRITASQFADVNAKLGGWDIDYNETTARIPADRPALERAYRSGAVDQADNLDQVAIIDMRGPDPGAFHDAYRTLVMRARLDREHGTHDNQVLWRGQAPILGDPTFVDDSIIAMDGWLAAVEKDPRDTPPARKIIEDKPATLVDRCTNGSGQDIPAAECDAVVQSYTDPRIEAGMPFTNDTIKCELRPLRRSSYFPVHFTDAEWAKLRKAFPDGVCDFAKPGVDRVPTSTWQTYQDSDGRVVYGGRSLGPVPRAEAIGARACPRRRTVRVGVRAPAGQRLRRATVYVDGRRAATRRRRGRGIAVRLRGLPRGAFTVRIVALTTSGRRIVVERRYGACAATRQAHAGRSGG